MLVGQSATVVLVGLGLAWIPGGGARSAAWRQILADVLGVDLVTVETTEGAAFGAALLAGVGAGRWGSVEEACRGAVKLGGVTRSRPEAGAAYLPLYRRFREHYPALRVLYGDAVASASHGDSVLSSATRR